jgi:hypothetical protein
MTHPHESKSSTDILINSQRYWLLVLLFIIPVSLRYVVERPFVVSVLNVICLVFIGLGFINSLRGAVPMVPIRHKSFMVVVGGLLLALAWALLFTHPLRNGMGLWISRLLIPLLVGFFTYQLFENKYLTLGQCLESLFWSLVPLTLLAGLQVTGIMETAHVGRTTALYEYPNTFARYLEIVLLLTLPFILFYREK